MPYDFYHALDDDDRPIRPPAQPDLPRRDFDFELSTESTRVRLSASCRGFRWLAALCAVALLAALTFWPHRADAPPTQPPAVTTQPPAFKPVSQRPSARFTPKSPQAASPPHVNSGRNAAPCACK